MLFTAAPEPAFSRGTTLMIDSVAGASTDPRPSPWTKRTPSTSPTGGSVPSSWLAANAEAIRPNPAAHTSLAPNRSASTDARGEASAMATAIGTRVAPDCSGENPSTPCR